LTAPVRIHASCTISMRSMILTHFDPGKARIEGTNYKAYAAGVEIGPRVYLGAGTVVLPGVRIGEDCIIGAHAVVARDVEPRSLAVGVPARVIRRINSDTYSK
jgi:maltose O-acetyltransferase